MDFYGFYTGQVFDAYQYLGAHRSGNGFVFRTFAPSASRIALIGEFSQWQEVPMQKIHDGNFWECFVEDAQPGMMYKYRIYRRDGGFMDHCDPYGFGMELRPNSASILRDLSYTFHDEGWMRRRTDGKSGPLNIFEVHFGSFQKPSDWADAWYSYEEMIDRLIPYAKDQGYNYLELMPLAEYPCDESWGYQTTGFFSPTSRYGTANQLKAFVDACHRENIGVIMDFVPVHFAVDGYALAQYDGTPLYEYPSSAVGESEWGSFNFMHSRGEVRSFLQSAANYWLAEYHMDGLRVDAVSRAIYWQGDPARGVNGNAVEFLKNMNRGLKERHPTAILAAEDSTTFPNVTKPAAEGGLGFDYKWDLGWMHDTLDYFRSGPEYRSRDYHKLTFAMSYFYGHRHLLPLSHDEVVHGKATILQQMNGAYEDKFPQARAFYMYMYAHPGKKLNFMGNEIGHFREWDEKREQDWGLLDYPVHQDFQSFMKALNHLYLTHPALWEGDYRPEGFQWLDCHQEERCIYAIQRSGGGERLAAVFNFSAQPQDYQLKIPKAGELRLVMSSELGTETVKRPSGGTFALHLTPFSGVYYQIM